MKKTVLVTVEGGIVQNITCTHPGIRVVVADFDKNSEETLSISEPRPGLVQKLTHLYDTSGKLTSDERKLNNYLKRNKL